MATTFSGKEFIKALAEDRLKEAIVREGIVKRDEGDPDALQFAAGTNCGLWVRVPVDMIEKVEFVTNVRCRDHQHPFVRLHFKDSAGSAEAAVFADLLRQSPQTSSAASERQWGARPTLASLLRGRGATGGRPLPQDVFCHLDVLDRYERCVDQGILGPHLCRAIKELGDSICDL